MLRAALSVPEPDPRERALAHTLGCPELVARVLLARGIEDPDAARSHLRHDLGQLHDPFQFAGMERAVARVKQAVQGRETVLVLGDYDVDGISGTVLLLKLFAMMEVDARPFIPARADGYSFGPATLAAIQKAGASLAISVDNGTNAVEWTRRIQEAGCDVIITDHHGTTDYVADAHVVLNPRLADAGYPDRDLAGVGVAFSLATAVAQSFSPRKTLTKEFREFLVDAMTYVALGTVADVAPLRGENRVMVHHGLKALRASGNPGIRALLDTAGIQGRAVEVEDIAFRIAPLINAAGRMSHALEAVTLLSAPGYAEAQDAAKILEDHNNARRKVERELTERVLAIAVECPDPILVLGGDGWHAGVLGIVAARMVDQLRKPTILVSFDGEVGRGSGRSPGTVHLRDAMSACSDLLVTYGGHAAAAGLEIRKENFDAFRQAINAAAAGAALAPPEFTVDGHAAFSELDIHTLRKLDLLGPFGMGNPRPRLMTENVKIVGHPTVQNRGQDLRFRVARDGVVFPTRVAHGASMFEEIRNHEGPVTIAYSPRMATRAEEGPVHLDVHVIDLSPASDARHPTSHANENRS